MRVALTITLSLTLYTAKSGKDFSSLYYFTKCQIEGVKNHISRQPSSIFSPVKLAFSIWLVNSEEALQKANNFFLCYKRRCLPLTESCTSLLYTKKKKGLPCKSKTLKVGQFLRLPLLSYLTGREDICRARTRLADGSGSLSRIGVLRDSADLSFSFDEGRVTKPDFLVPKWDLRPEWAMKEVIQVLADSPSLFSSEESKSIVERKPVNC